jgi:hypothetical protein
MEKKMKNDEQKIRNSMKLFLLEFLVMSINMGVAIFLVFHEYFYMGYFLIFSTVFFFGIRIINKSKEIEKIEDENWKKMKKEMTQRVKNGESINV